MLFFNKIKELKADVEWLKKRREFDVKEIENLKNKVYEYYHRINTINNYIIKECCNNCCHIEICKKKNDMDEVIKCEENKNCEFQALR